MTTIEQETPSLTITRDETHGLLEQTLEEVNLIRRRYNATPLTDLPTGHIESPDTCPIANALKTKTTWAEVGEIGGITIYQKPRGLLRILGFKGEAITVVYNDTIEKFVRYFDTYHYPQYVRH